MSYLPPMLAKYLMLSRHSNAQDQEVRQKHLQWMANKGYAKENDAGAYDVDMSKVHNDLNGFALSNVEFANSIGSNPEDLYGETTRHKAWIDHTKKVMRHYPDFIKYLEPQDRMVNFQSVMRADFDPEFQDRYAGTIEKYMGDNGHSRSLRWRAEDNRRAAEGRPTHFDLGYNVILPQDDSPEATIMFNHPVPEVEAQMNNPDKNMDFEQIILTFAPEYMQNYYNQKGFTNEQQEPTDS